MLLTVFLVLCFLGLAILIYGLWFKYVTSPALFDFYKKQGILFTSNAGELSSTEAALDYAVSVAV